MPPIALSDDEMAVLMNAARPIPPAARAEFLQAVAKALAAHPGELGVGAVYRIAAATQRQFYDPPDLSRGSVSKHQRR